MEKSVEFVSCIA